ncbi:hypothetical protein GE061_020291 [Apolygus lucorum]|uniref:Uncharacterized protein n=1 Tax=Apolygus lucorum TaxID=248454 RepID=A0A8S9WND5_APOLU|nr:hypothetical protein GE061_020291 [Apolygus lucorum]
MYDLLPLRDYGALAKYAAQITTLEDRNDMLLTNRHVAVHTILKIQRASPQRDYIYESSFDDLCLLVDWKFNERGCKNISCYPRKLGLSKCTKFDNPVSIRMGRSIYDSKGDPSPRPISKYFDVCQPACFALKHDNSSLTSCEDSADQKIDVPRDEGDSDSNLPHYLSWDPETEKCFRDDVGMTSMYLDPLLRLSNDSYAPLSDDVVFDLKVAKLDPFTKTVITVGRINSEYCKQFQMDMVEDGDNVSADQLNKEPLHKCDLQGREYLLSIFIGTSLIRLYKLGKDKLEHLIIRLLEKADGEKIRYWPPTKREFESVISWKAQSELCPHKIPIPRTVTLSELGLVGKHKWDIWTDDVPDDVIPDKYGGRIIKNESPPSDEEEKNNRVFLFPMEKVTTATTQKRRKRDIDQIKDGKEQGAASKGNKDAPNEGEGDSGVSGSFTPESLEKLLESTFDKVYAMITSHEAWKNLFAGLSADYVLRAIKSRIKVITPVVSNMVRSPIIMETLLPKIVPTKLLMFCTSTLINFTALRQTIVSVGRVAAMFGRLAVGSISVIGWIMVVGTLLDLFFGWFYDPLKFNTEAYADYHMELLSKSVLASMQEAGGGNYATEMTPSDAWGFYMAPSSSSIEARDLKIIEVYAHCTFLYMQHRSITSEGTQLNWLEHGIIKGGVKALETNEEVRTIFDKFNIITYNYSDVDAQLHNKTYCDKMSRINSYFLICWSTLCSIIIYLIAYAFCSSTSYSSSSDAIDNTFSLTTTITLAALSSMLLTTYLSVNEGFSFQIN